ncbi:MAG: S9 family peptidase [Acidimicrobiales bacterium]
MVPTDIAAVVSASDPRVSPDGSQVAFVVTRVDHAANEYRSAIWLAATDGPGRARPFTAGDRRDVRPRWAPDGRDLAFVSHRADGGSTLHVLPVAAGGETVTVATWPEEIEALAWSPDGTSLAFLARQRDEDRYGHEHERDQPPRRIDRLFFRHDTVGWTVDRPRHLFVVTADGSGPPRAVSEGPFEHGGLAWSPDGTSLVSAAGRHDSWDLDRATDLYRFRADGTGGAGGTGGDSAPERLTPTGPDHGLPSFSGDGRRVAFVQWDPISSPRHAQIGVLDVNDDGPSRLLTTSLDRNCAPYPPAREPIWNDDDVLFAVEDAGNVHLYRVAADGSSPPVLVVGGEREVTGWDMAAGVVAFCASTPTGPAEVHVRRPDGQEVRLTAVGAGFGRARRLVAPERFVATSADGTEVEAWLIRPAGFEEGCRYPVLLNVHGGPFTQYGNVFFDEFQIQAGAGYAVLYSNPRGSSGYSEAWGRAIRGPKAPADPGSGWGGVDYDDLMAVVDEALVRFDFLDGEAMGMLGGSYGGYMATWMAGHTDRFKAICSERAVNNLLSLEQTSDVATAFAAQIGVSHLDDPAEYLRQSPITFVREITTPMLLVHSEADLRCPVSQAEELFVALRLLGRTVELVRFPGESHELSRSGSPRHRIQRAEIILAFFDRHLKPPPTT